MPTYDKKTKKILITAAVIIILIIAFEIFFQTRKTTVNITSDPVNIEVDIGQSIYQTPTTIKIKPGKYRVWGLKEKYLTYDKFNKFYYGKENNLYIKLEVDPEPEPTEGAPPPGYVEKKPQIKNLPYENNHFRILWDIAYNKYIIVPKIPFGPEDAPVETMRNNWNQYQQYSKEALDWMKNQGVTPSKDNIIWWMQDFWPEGAAINF